MTTETIHESIEKLTETVETLEKIVSKLEERIEKLEEKKTIAFNYAELPDNLRKTMNTIYKLKEANASQVAEETGKTRGIESLYLNQLHRMGHLDKNRKGRKTYFKLLQVI